MNERALQKIAIWLELIADELYSALSDKDIEGARGSGPDMWSKQGRDHMVNLVERSWTR
jgi:hypothetical protein